MGFLPRRGIWHVWLFGYHGNQSNSEIWIKFIWLVEDHSSNISVKLLSKYLQWDSSNCQFSFFPIVSQWQLYVAIATRVLIRLEQKTIVFVPPVYRCYMWNMARIGFMASEEMLFENVNDGRTDNDDGQTTYACLYSKLTYEPLAQVS